MPIDLRPRYAVAAILASVLCFALAADARAHFLFVRIGPVAEGGRSAEVYFSEQAKAGDPRFIPKIAHTKLWAQLAPGQFEELKVQAGADRLRSILPSSRNLGVIGECRYGVLARPGQPPFLLRHYPKAVAGAADEINRLQRRAEIPFEIMGTIELPPGGSNSAEAKAETSGIRLVALRNGKVMPGVVFHSVDTDLVEAKFSAGADGAATWKPPSAGRYCFYVADTLKEPGELDGKQYEEVRDFATLTIDWPIGAGAPDPEATALFKKAIAKRAQWHDFPGFSAEIGGDLDGRAFNGNVTIDATGRVEVKVDDDAAEPWLREQLESLVRHRLPSPGLTDNTSEMFTLRFGDEGDEHPLLGRLLLVDGGRMASSYRIKDDEIMVVNRNLGRQSMTLRALTNEENREGLMLPVQYVVNYWDADSGRLNRTDTIEDHWIRVASWDLPTTHAVSTASDGGMSIRTFSLSKHALLKRP